ncbi:hypothetical protein JCM3775_006802 [Rhodotorula graminis]|uniref:dihydrolipoyllysine-residue succinyltransferase n=1 Tax=Rhodotorula graminis (strain WP1) TaxID=578459 RepID=A0A194S451_RHOGW|nr:uncharacterized protein RHOBADRAFT_43803 [Rhodotorula graminis WP1]KPV75299.1 hypothetical protein RHOBADRAFT_43803 [Rhodotorula graminis WP1]
MLAVRATAPRALARTARCLASTAAPALARSALAGSARTQSPRLALPALARSFHASPLSLDEIVKVPSMAESITEGTLKQWLKQKGDYVEADEEVATIETDKIDVAVNAPRAGTLTELLANEEDTVTVGQDLFKLEAGGSKPEAKEEPKKDDSPEKDQATSAKEEPKKDESSSSAPKEQPKKEEANPEPKSEYRKPDSATPAPKVPEQAKKQEGKTAPESPPKQGSRNETRVKMSRMRSRIAERLKEAQNTAASLTTFNEIDMSALMAFRSKYKDQVLKDHGVKLGFMSAFVKASSVALRELPAVNASIDGSDLVYHDYADISVAVSTPKGLVTPVLRNAEGFNFVEIEREIAALGKKARDGKLTLEDMNGGTFTISNGGVFGSLMGTPILNTPQAAVLGMHAINQRPWVDSDGKIVVRPIMTVALTYDHRIIDGREAVTFLVLVKKLIEDPALLNLYN